MQSVVIVFLHYNRYMSVLTGLLLLVLLASIGIAVWLVKRMHKHVTRNVAEDALRELHTEHQELKVRNQEEE